jgi:hypothetical protein
MFGIRDLEYDRNMTYSTYEKQYCSMYFIDYSVGKNNSRNKLIMRDGF